MTLIIGSISEEFGIIAGDTQLSRSGLNRKGKIDKSIELKTDNYGTNFLMGILGKWVSWYHNNDNPSHYVNQYDNLREGLNKIENADKKLVVEKFLKNRSDLDASAIYINRTENGFELQSTSSKSSKRIKGITKENIKLMFNEPYCRFNENLIQETIEKFVDDHDLSESLSDQLFLVNNIILNFITEGDTIDLINKDENITCFGIDNTIGGYVTIQVITTNKHLVSDFSLTYSSDVHSLNDHLTFPFAKKLNRDKEIRYIDNLAMIIKNINSPFNEPIQDSILSFANKQIQFLLNENLIDCPILNSVIDLCNEKYGIKLPKVFSDKEEENVEIIFEQESVKPKLDYYLQFFT